VSWPVIAALPFAGLLILKLFRGATGTQINPILGQTALYQAVVTILFLVSVGLSNIR
jgi:1,4-dihydroxy-2-naphthoate octaprenyltransferase